MKIPPPRITLRWLLVVVAVAGVASWWLIARRERFKRLAAYHQTQALKNTIKIGGRTAIVGGPLTDWHLSISAKYTYAVAHPWLPVAEDPPDPMELPTSGNLVPQPQ